MNACKPHGEHLRSEITHSIALRALALLNTPPVSFQVSNLFAEKLGADCLTVIVLWLSVFRVSSLWYREFVCGL